MKNAGTRKIEAITPQTLIVGVDIAKQVHWARFVDYRGIELGKALKFDCNKSGFESIIANIDRIYKTKNLNNVIVGITGHY